MLLYLPLLISCDEKKNNLPNSEQITTNHAERCSEINHATGFKIVIEDGIKKIHILNPFSNYEVEQTIVLLQKEQTYSGKDGELLIQIPIKTIAPFSTTFYSSIAELNQTKSIVAIANSSFVFSSAIQNAYSKREIAQVGDGEQLNIEKLILLYPDVVVVNGFQGGLTKSFKQVQKAGIPVLINYDWKEITPLARAEWIKFFGALYNENELADSIFNQIETNYLHYVSQLDTVTYRPNVLFSSAYQGTWYIPGGESYVAQFLKDAKGAYPWSDDKSTGSLPLNMEVVAEKMLEADIWIASESTSLDNLKQKDVRYAAFKPFQEGNIFEHDKRRRKMGGDDFWETGALRVDLILRDYINILHPHILKDSSLTFFRKLD